MRIDTIRYVLTFVIRKLHYRMKKIQAGEIDQDYLYWAGDATIYNNQMQMLWEPLIIPIRTT